MCLKRACAQLAVLQICPVWKLKITLRCLPSLSVPLQKKHIFLICRRYKDLRVYEAVTHTSTLLVEVARNASPTSAAVAFIGYSLKSLLQVNTPHPLPATA